MLIGVVPVLARAAIGDTVMVDGRPLAVVRLLPRRRVRASRTTAAPPCGICERALRWDAVRRGWCCPDCNARYPAEALADLLREHLVDGIRAGKARRNRAARAQQVTRGAPGAAAVLLRDAADGGAPGRHDLFARSGARSGGRCATPATPPP